MPGRTTRNGQPQITRQDIQDSITDLKKQLLDPEAPSLLSMMKSELGGIKTRMDDHDRKVTAISNDFNEFKQVYASDKGKVKGWLLGAGAGGGAGVVAAIKAFLFTK